jgi:hypothetical protein
MTHLTPDEFVDAVERTLAPNRQQHLADCEPCRERLARLGGVLAEVHAVEVPEPSPLFWDHLSENVRRSVAAEPRVPPRPARWFDWPVLVPLGALAGLLLALVSAVPHGAADVARLQLAMSLAGDSLETDAAVDSDDHWELMAMLVGEVDFDAVDQEGITAAPGTVDAVLPQLTSAEQQELMRLLREELEGSGG